MREIRFRAWDGKRMQFCGKNGYNDFIIEGGIVSVFGAWDLGERNNPNWPLMQHTGLDDFYEDDLISNNLGTDKETIRQVKLINGCWMLSRVKGNSSLPKNISLYEFGKLNFPIVGNVHQNSDLLK